MQQGWYNVISTLCNIVSTLFQRRTLTLYQRWAILKIQRRILFHFKRQINVVSTLIHNVERTLIRRRIVGWFFSRWPTLNTILSIAAERGVVFALQTRLFKYKKKEQMAKQHKSEARACTTKVVLIYFKKKNGVPSRHNDAFTTLLQRRYPALVSRRYVVAIETSDDVTKTTLLQRLIKRPHNETLQRRRFCNVVWCFHGNYMETSERRRIATSQNSPKFPLFQNHFATNRIFFSK